MEIIFKSILFHSFDSVFIFDARNKLLAEANMTNRNKTNTPFIDQYKA